MDDVRWAVITAHELHIKWNVRRDVTPVSIYILPGNGTLEDTGKRSETRLIDDDIHFIHFDTDYTLNLRRHDNGKVVWQLPSKRREKLRGFSCTIHEGDIIIMFQRTTDPYNEPDSYYGRMEIWRYKGSGNCSPVYSLDIVDTSLHALDMDDMYPHPPVAHGGFIRGVYAGRLCHNAQAISVSNWLAGTHVSFEVNKVNESLIYKTFVTDGTSA